MGRSERTISNNNSSEIALLLQKVLGERDNHFAAKKEREKQLQRNFEEFSKDMGKETGVNQWM